MNFFNGEGGGLALLLNLDLSGAWTVELLVNIPFPDWKKNVFVFRSWEHNVIAGFQTSNDWYVKQDTFIHSLQTMPVSMHFKNEYNCLIFVIVWLSRAGKN